MELFVLKDGQIILNEDAIGSLKASDVFFNLIEDDENLETIEFVCGDCNCDSCSDQYETENGIEYDLFYDDEIEDGIRLDIDPSQVWTKDDALELINHILYAVGETDEDGNFISEGNDSDLPTRFLVNADQFIALDNYEEEIKEKPLFVLSYPGHISSEKAEAIKDSARKTLNEAGIDAVPFILLGDAKAYFEAPPIR